MLNRLPNENEESCIWRIGQSKDNGAESATWSEIAEFLNREFRDSEDEYYCESAYRKAYQQAKRFYESGVFNKYADESEYAQEIRKERMKLSDERTALNKKLRDSARNEIDIDNLYRVISETGSMRYPQYTAKVEQSDNDLIVCLSDLHLGISVGNAFGEFNSDVAAERINKYLSYISGLRDVHNASGVTVLLLGDLISGSIHPTTQLENRENVVQQIMVASDIVSNFVYQLSTMFNNVNVVSVGGNHSRIGLKENVLRGEKLDDIVVWYTKAALNHIKNVTYDLIDVDPTLKAFNVRGLLYFAVHGDCDEFTEKGLSKLIIMTKAVPHAIFYGHLHRCSYEEIGGVKLIRSGSLAGTCDDYTVSKRLAGTPSQMVCVANDSGISAMYPVSL